MKTKVCLDCGLQVKLNHKFCPLCQGKMKKSGQEFIETNQTINNQHRSVILFYTCIKCKGHSNNKICVQCNRSGLLSISYSGKTAIIKQLNSLFEIYSKQEAKLILSQLTLSEKYLIYRELASTRKMLLKKDPLKASVCFFVGFLMYFLLLSITLNFRESNILFGHISIAFGNANLSLFIVLGIKYLFNAHHVEDGVKIIGIITGISHFLFLLICIFLDLTFVEGFSLGFAFIFITILILILKRDKNA